MPIRIRVLVVGALAALTVLLPASTPAQTNALSAVVGPGFNIGLFDASGARVVHLDPGTYSITVQDKADIHNFHLTGPGVDMATDPEFVGTVTWTVTLVDGSYHFQCDPHSTQMKGNFTVGSVPAPKPKPKPKVATLTATAGAQSVSLKSTSGAGVTTRKAGKVKIVVHDKSAKQNFHLVGPGVDRKTGLAFTGTATWTLTLRVGKYHYWSDAAPKAKHALKIT
ncbi:MAG: hypothetical protein QOE36_74 [Gaiellaceae bacterium]|jgi:hypothetical protein|nr:hypothetical protein [Gaiellaceae bacterium]